ncbi:MAG: hypothetical protein E6G07_01150 [Actinobacteria bacterium]|nr:MAG: hypothetical protein E6G07_01150 [Actinomycetota bacterium]
MTRDRRRRRGRLVWAAGLVATAVLLFGIGVAVGEALHDNPRPGRRQTSIGTIILTATHSGVSK